MTENSNNEGQDGKTWFDRLLEKNGIKVRKVDTPKDFFRVIIPGIRWNVADWTDPEDETPGTLTEEDPS